MGAYQNVMEVLVEEEVTRQFKVLPPRVAAYISQTELVAYALNQLPSLYATSKKGLAYQLQRGRKKYAPRITQAVQQSVAAISRDPLRTSVPLQPQQSTPLREVLHQLRILLRNDKVDWETLPTAVAQAIARANPESLDWSHCRATRFPAARAPLHRSFPLPPHPSVEQYGVDGYGVEPPTHRAARNLDEMTNKKTVQRNRDNNIEQNPSRTEAFGWDDPLYNSH